VERFLRRLVTIMQAGLGCSGCEMAKLMKSMVVRVASRLSRRSPLVALSHETACSNLRLNQARGHFKGGSHQTSTTLRHHRRPWRP
jgi:hypothetical protein